MKLWAISPNTENRSHLPKSWCAFECTSVRVQWSVTKYLWNWVKAFHNLARLKIPRLSSQVQKVNRKQTMLCKSDIDKYNRHLHVVCRSSIRGFKSPRFPNPHGSNILQDFMILGFVIIFWWISVQTVTVQWFGYPLTHVVEDFFGHDDVELELGVQKCANEWNLVES